MERELRRLLTMQEDMHDQLLRQTKLMTVLENFSSNSPRGTLASPLPGLQDDRSLRKDAETAYLQEEQRYAASLGLAPPPIIMDSEIELGLGFLKAPPKPEDVQPAIFRTVSR